MGLFDGFKKKKKAGFAGTGQNSETHEFCPRCDANLRLQKGYRNDLPYWTCRGCGAMLINPAVENDDVWICDECGTTLNIQEGFSENKGEWTCKKCGHVNRIDESVLYESEEEYEAEKRSPYKGLSDGDVLSLALYQDIEHVGDRPDIILVKHRESGQIFIKKLLTTYVRSVYDYLKENPVEHMPLIYEIYESENCLIVIEEFIEGKNIADLLEKEAIPEDRAVSIAIDVCRVLERIHGLPTPIIHRDIKPSNIMVTPEGETYLLDMNVAKWFNPEKNDDTRYMGTMFYAAPEQVGYGLSASSAKSDIYAIGVLLNVMVTQKFPKEERAEGKLWDIIERCISLNADDRYTAAELMEELNELREEINAEKINRRAE